MTIEHPEYYNRGGLEVLTAVDAWGLNYYKGTALKYIVRAGYKEGNSELDDILKAIYYLSHYADLLKNEKTGE